LLPDGEAYPEVVATFGTEILDEDGTISRPKLGAIVFSAPDRLDALNAISHPNMAGRMSREIRQMRGKPPAEQPPLIVLDAAILFEAGWDALCGQVWTVEAPPEATVERLTAGGRFNREEAQARLDAQMSNAERAQRADRVILNTGSIAALEAAVRRVWKSAVEAAVETE
jgi:dephospho-CoA kinase